MSVVLSISSHVMRGHVGNRAAGPALVALGHEVWPLNTVALAHHPGHDRAVARLVTPAATIAEFVASLERQGWLGAVDGVLIGYVAAADQADAIAAAVARVRAVRRDALILLDPILGDHGKLYVGEDVAHAVRDRLVPLADIATPNAFELGWLTGAEIGTVEEVRGAAHGLGPAEVVVTSAPGGTVDQVRTLAVSGDEAWVSDAPQIDTAVHGAGDLFAGLYLGRRLNGEAVDIALACSVGAVGGVLEETRRLGRDELALNEVGLLSDSMRLSVASPVSRAGADVAVAGVDGCPGGWLVVLFPDGNPAHAELHFASHFSEIFEWTGSPDVVAVDMPIGLPERMVGRGRACEVEARAGLGPRQSSVFSIPSRSAVMEDDYRAACQASHVTSDPPRKVSRQAFALFAKIRELDTLLRQEPVLAGRVFECHPEVSFAEMRGGRAADHPKKVKSRPNPAGLDERRRYLVRNGFSVEFLTPMDRLPGRAGLDDLIDAAVAAWTARRIALGIARCIPEEPPRDAHGLEMAIRA